MEVINLFYLAKPKYGGWVTFTAHLAHRLLAQGYKVNLFKIGKRTEKQIRDFGYGLAYKNISINAAKKSENGIITAVDKNYIEAAKQLKRSHKLVIHDPTEIRPETKVLLDRFEIITIRKTVHDFLEQKGINSKFILHPFYEYEKEEKKKVHNVSISRIDYDKNMHFICEANKQLEKPINIYGAANRLYIFFKLKELWREENYKGTFSKDFRAIGRILDPAKYVIDMSTINKDGGGTQYTFLEAIHHNCVLILNKKWIEAGDTFKSGYNCLEAENESDIIKHLNSDIDTKKIIKNARKILANHTTDINIY
jgi:hypothetical protein